MGVLKFSHNFFTSRKLFPLYKSDTLPCMEYASHHLSGSTYRSFKSGVYYFSYQLSRSRLLSPVSFYPLNCSYFSYYSYYNGEQFRSLQSYTFSIEKDLCDMSYYLNTQSHPFYVQLSSSGSNSCNQYDKYSAGNVCNTLILTIFSI